MTSPYSYEGQADVPAIHAAAADRARFLQRTYSTLFLGILGLCASLWGFSHIPAMQELGFMLLRNPILYIVAFLGITYGVHAVAEVRPINVVAYAVYIVFFGLMLTPLVTIAANYDGMLNQAVLITAVVFSGLTGYVFWSGKDFSFLGGALSVMFFALIAIGLGGWLFGFHLGMAYTVAVALFYALYILYDTSKILHHYPTTAHMTAAIVLFTDVVLLFKQILILLLQARDD
jgi:FtsH-binding integral membrane protein